jgi:cell shape-determining protein MreC
MGVFRPFFVIGKNIGERANNFRAYFLSKKSLQAENDKLQNTILEYDAKLSNYNALFSENESLKEILGRKGETSMTLAGILAKPNQSPYDTLIIDAGSREGITNGTLVFAFGNVPIGRVAEVDEATSRVVLFSTPGEKTQVVISGKGNSMELVGRGGGNFEMIIPRDFSLLAGEEAVLPGNSPYTVAKVVKTISDPRDPFTKALLVSPINIFDLQHVEVERK